MIEAILAACLLLCIITASVKRPKNFPKGPSLLHCLTYITRDPQAYFDWVGKKYGGLAGVVLPGYKFIIANSKEAISELLWNPNCQGRPQACLINDRFDGANRGIIFTDGEAWKESRKFTLCNLKNAGFGQVTHEDIIAEQRDLLVDYIYRLKEKPLNIEDFLYLPNINTVWNIVGGASLPLESTELHLIRQSIKDIMHNMSIIGSITVLLPFLRFIFPERTGYKPLKRGSRYLRKFCMKSIQEHKETMNSESPRDFIDIWLTQLAEHSNGNMKEHFTELELEGVCIDLLLASDTTVATLTFAILHICLNPDIQDRIYNEIISEIGTNAKITVEDRNRLVYTEAFLMEILRCKTPAPTTIPHRVMENTVVSGYCVPKDVILFLNLKTMLMDKRHWGDPENFRPERFINEDKTIKKDEWLLPFGKGPRTCFGNVAAKSILFVWLSSFIQNFSIAFAPGHTPKTVSGTPTIVVAPPKFKIICSPRNKAATTTD